MEINVYRRRNSIPGTTGGVPISPDKVAEPYIAEAQQGAAVSRLGFQSAELNNQYLAAEKRAERVVASQRLELALDEDFTTAKLESQSEEDAKQRIDAIRANRVDSIADPIVKRAVEMAWAKRANDLRIHARTEKIKALTTESNNMYEADYVRAIDSYARETDPVKQAVIKDTLQIKGLELEAAKVRQPGSTERKMLQFDKDAGIVRDAYARDAKAAEVEKQKAIKEQQTLQSEEAEKEMSVLFRSGKLGYITLDKYRKVLSADDYQKWNKMIMDRTERISKELVNGPTKTDKVLEKNLYVGIQKTSDPATLKTLRNQVLDAYANGKINKPDPLINDIDKKLQPEKEKQGLGDKTQKDIIIKRIDDDYKNGLFGDDEDESAQLLIDVSRSYEEWAADPANKGKPHLEWYQQVMKPYQESTIKSLLSGTALAPIGSLFGNDKPNPRKALDSMKGSKKPDPLGIR